MLEEKAGWLRGWPFLKVPPAEYHEACLFAYCAGAAAGSGRDGRQEAVCTTLASYARDCGRQGIYLSWRKPGFCGRTPACPSLPPRPPELGID